MPKSISSLIFVCFAALALNFVHASSAFASHFRYGTITWQVVDPANPRVVTVRFDSAWRWSFFGSPPLGSSINVGSLMITAPGKSVAINAIGSVSSIDSVFDYMTISQTFTFTFDATWGNNPQVYFTSCCRISSLLEGNNDRSFYVSTGITLMSPVNQPPTVATPPIIGVRFNQPNTIQLTAVDPNGDPLTFRYATSAESLLSNPSPTGMTLSTGGLITFTPTLQGYYSTQIRVTDSHGAYTVADLIFYSSNAVGADPRVYIDGVAAPKTITKVHSQPITFTVTGFDPEASPVTLTSGTLPPGSSMSPSLPVTAVNASSTFTWTPPPSALGSYVIPFSALDGNFRSSFQTVTLNVINSPPAIQCAVPPSIAATSQAGGLVSMSADVDDADGDPLSVSVFIDSILRSVSGLLTPPATYAFSGNVSAGPHGYQMRVSDGVSTPVQCAGTFNVTDTMPPVLSLPADISLVATGAGGAIATFAASASDAIDATPTVTCAPASGSTFPVGTTPVTCTATDDANNSVQGTFLVNVLAVPTSLSPLPTINTLTGNTMTISTTLSRAAAPVGPLAGQPVLFTITPPSGSVFTLTQTTDTQGVATLSGFPVTERGVHTIEASFAASSWLQPTAAAGGTATAYQRTAFQLNPVGAEVTGAPYPLSAFLGTFPEGYAINGQSVTFSFAGGVLPSQTVTTSGGFASAPLTFADAGVYSVTASFANAAAFYTDAAGSLPPQPTVATQTITIARAETAISMSVPPTGFVGGNVVLSAALQRISAPAGAVVGGAVEFVLVGPSPFTTESVIPATTDPAGMAYAVATGLSRGAYTVTARFAQTSSLAASTSLVSPLSIYQRTALVMPVAHGVAETPMTLTAELVAVPQGTPIDGQVITFTSITGTQSAVTNPSGLAQVSTTFPYAVNTLITATFNNVADYFADALGNLSATSVLENAEIISAQTALTPLVIPAIAYSGIPVDVSTTLSRTVDPAGPLGNQPVTFTLSGADGPNSQTYTITTAPDGSASASLTLNRGVYSVVAEFPGTQALSSATTSTTVTSWQKTAITLSGASTIPGTPVTLTAVLKTVPGGLALEGQPVHFSFGGVIPDADVVTGPTGSASVTMTFPSVGTFPVSASFHNDVAYYVNHLGQPAAETATVAVVINDPTPPVIVPTVAGTVGSNGWYTSDVTVSWSVTDPDTAIDSSAGCGATTITTDGASFSFTCSATSSGGTSTATVSFKRDATPPTQTLPANITVPAVNAAGVPVTYSVTRNDDLSGVASFNCAPASGATFAAGTTTVMCSVTDAAGLTTTGSFTVTVLVTDTAPPVISGATPSQSSMWPPDHRMVPITISVSATDNGGAPVCAIASITSNEPQNGLGDGDTPNDWLITAPLTAQLRAERAGNGNGRVYTLAIRCVDAAGNAAMSSTTVSVPKSRK